MLCMYVSLLSLVMDAIVGRQTNMLLAGIHAIAIYNTDQGHNSCRAFSSAFLLLSYIPLLIVIMTSTSN